MNLVIIEMLLVVCNYYLNVRSHVGSQGSLLQN